MCLFLRPSLPCVGSAAVLYVFFSQLMTTPPALTQRAGGLVICSKKTGDYSRRDRRGGIVDRVMKDYATPQQPANILVPFVQKVILS